MKLLRNLCLPLLFLTPWALANDPGAVGPKSHFVLQVVGEVPVEEQRKVLQALEANYARVGADLKTTPDWPFNIFFYSGRLAYARATGNWGASGNAEGPAKLHLMPSSRDGDKAEVVAVHEFAHSVTLRLLLNQEPLPLDTAKFDRKFEKFPVWLWEAIAVYEARQFVPPKGLRFISRNSYPSLAELNNRSQGGKIYKIGFTVVEYILAEYGQDGLIKLILAYGDTGVLGKTAEEFAQGWHRFVVQKYL
jgi:hypothetical protein